MDASVESGATRLTARRCKRGSASPVERRICAGSLAAVSDRATTGLAHR
jgi:hypothetical protein